MEENKNDLRRFRLRDLTMALSTASDEELIEFAAVREHRVDAPYRAASVWNFLSAERQRAILEETPWVAAFLSPEQKDRFTQGLDGIKCSDWLHQKSEPDPAAEPKPEPAPEPEPQKASWWQFWK